MVPAGTSLWFTVTGGVHEFIISGYSEADLRQAVIAKLAQRFEVLSLTLKTDEGFFSQSWSYTATVNVRTVVDYASLADAQSIVYGAFWEAADAEPIVTQGRSSQTDPRRSDSGFGLGFSLGAGALIVVGALVLVIWARP
jgi:hypothetical protein